MKKIIVTIVDGMTKNSMDVEIPTSQPMETLKYDIAEAINKGEFGMRINADVMDLYSRRLRRMFFPTDTCESTGVWNGDILDFIVRNQ